MKDLSACAAWRPALPFADAWLGCVPGWNAVTALNASAAILWDLLIQTQDHTALEQRYAEAHPERAAHAAKDIETCCASWSELGLLRPLPPPPATCAAPLAREIPRPSPACARDLACGAAQVRFEIEDPALGAALLDLTAGFPDAPPRCAALRPVRVAGPEGGWRLIEGDAVLRRAADPVELRGLAVGHLVRLAAGDTPWLGIAHGTVLTRGGRTLFMAGASGAGKSTLAAGLVARGWQMLDEDMAPFRAPMQVTPLPFALSVKQGSWDLLRQDFPQLATARTHPIGARQVRYHRLDSEAQSTAPATPDLILDVRYDPKQGPEGATLRPLDPMSALTLFLNDESFLDLAHNDLAVFTGFVENTPAGILRHGSIDAAEKTIECYITMLKA